jgi:hypothetical protein
MGGWGNGSGKCSYSCSKNPPIHHLPARITDPRGHLVFDALLSTFSFLLSRTKGVGVVPGIRDSPLRQPLTCAPNGPDEIAQGKAWRSHTSNPP